MQRQSISADLYESLLLAERARETSIGGPRLLHSYTIIYRIKAHNMPVLLWAPLSTSDERRCNNRRTSASSKVISDCRTVLIPFIECAALKAFSFGRDEGQTGDLYEGYSSLDSQKHCSRQAKAISPGFAEYLNPITVASQDEASFFLWHI